MKPLYVIAAALLAGVAGGSLGAYAVIEHERGRAVELVRARRFELTNKAGRVTSSWGEDRNQQSVLTFGDQEQAGQAPSGVPADGATSPIGKHGPQLAIGTYGPGGRPFLSLNGSDGQLRVLLDMDDFERPSLMMKDNKVLGLSLGSERSDTPSIRDRTERWSLNFSPNEAARIGVTADTEQGFNPHGFVHANHRTFKSEAFPK